MPMSDLALALKNPVEWISFSRVAGRARAKSSAVRYRVKSVRVTAFTRSSVHWAERMVAARSSSGVVKSSSIPAVGYALARRPRIFTALAFLACADSAMTGLGEGGADLADAPSDFVRGERLRLVGHAPHGPARLGIAGQARHEMPVDVRHLIAEEFVVHLDGLVDGGQRAGHTVHVLDLGRPLARRELVELDRMTLEHHEHPAGKELVLVEVDAARGQVGDEERPLSGHARAHHAVGCRHGDLRAR